MNEKLQTKAREDKPWMKHFGTLSKLHEENRRIAKIIEKEFEQVDNARGDDPQYQRALSMA